MWLLADKGAICQKISQTKLFLRELWPKNYKNKKMGNKIWKKSVEKFFAATLVILRHCGDFAPLFGKFDKNLLKKFFGATLAILRHFLALLDNIWP